MFEVDDIKSFEQNLQKNNVKIIRDIKQESYGKILTFEDPNGHWLEIFETNKLG